MNTKRVLVVAFAVVVVAVGALSATMVLSNAEYDPHNGEKWHSEFDSAQQAAQASGEPMLVYFWSEDCSYCEEFNSKLQNNAKLQDSVDRYVLVSAEYVNQPQLRERYDVTGTPTVVVVTPDGEQVTSIIPSQVADPAAKLDQAYETARQ